MLAYTRLSSLGAVAGRYPLLLYVPCRRPNSPYEGKRSSSISNGSRPTSAILIAERTLAVNKGVVLISLNSAFFSGWLIAELISKSWIRRACSWASESAMVDFEAGTAASGSDPMVEGNEMQQWLPDMLRMEPESTESSCSFPSFEIVKQSG